MGMYDSFGSLHDDHDGFSMAPSPLASDIEIPFVSCRVLVWWVAFQYMNSMGFHALFACRVLVKAMDLPISLVSPWVVTEITSQP